LTRIALRALIALVIIAGAALAQGRVELQAGYAYTSPGGDFKKEAQLIEAGGGLDIALTGPWKRWAVAIGLVSTKHAVDYDPLDADEADLRMVQVYGELRHPLPQLSIARPYLAARLQYVSMWNSTAFTDDQNLRVEGDASQSGPALGVSAGLTVPVARWFSIYVNAGWVQAWLGDIDFDGNKIAGSSVSGPLPGVRFGGTIDFSSSQ
jgi:hypothetical protein